MKKFMSGFLLATFLFAGMLMAFAATNKSIEVKYNNIRIMVDGKFIDTGKAEPFIFNGYTYIPARFVAENLGATVKFNDTYNAVDIKSAAAARPIPAPKEEPVVNDTLITQTPDGITTIDTWEGKQYIGCLYIRNMIRKNGYDFIKNNSSSWNVVKDGSTLLEVPTKELTGYGYDAVEVNYYINTILPLVK